MATTAAAHAPILLPSPPTGVISNSPHFSPLNQGSSRLSDAELARRLQSEEDERLARALSSSLNVPVTAGRPSPVPAQNTATSNRPISQGSQDVGVLFYPSINYDSGAAQSGSSTPPTTRPPQPTTGGGNGGSQVPPNPLYTSPFAENLNGPQTAPSAPAAAAANVTAAGAAAGADSLGDSGICCVCLDARATYGFIHPAGVCVDLCSDCASDYISRNDRKCPVCRQDGEIKKIFIH
jgi:hypothetical protein